MFTDAEVKPGYKRIVTSDADDQKVQREEEVRKKRCSFFLLRIKCLCLTCTGVPHRKALNGHCCRGSVTVFISSGFIELNTKFCYKTLEKNLEKL